MLCMNGLLTNQTELMQTLVSNSAAKPGICTGGVGVGVGGGGCFGYWKKHQTILTQILKDVSSD